MTAFYGTKETNHQQRAKSYEDRAGELCRRALKKADELFERGDLTPYLTVLARLHTFNFYNLLLILCQYPTATHLGSFKNWQRLMKRQEPGKTWVLRQSQKGKGIELVAPFTNLLPEGTLSLTWHPLLQFDVSQTNLSHYEAPRSIYTSGPRHIHDLIRALRGVLSQEHGVTVLTDPSFDVYRFDNPGYIEGNTVHCNPNISAPELMMWLTESLLTLTYPEQVLGARYKRLFLRMAQYCLFQIWGMEDHRMLYLPQDTDLIRSISTDLRPPFLDLLQRRVRRVEEDIYSKYQEQLQERDAQTIANILPPFRHLNREGGARSYEDPPSGLE